LRLELLEFEEEALLLVIMNNPNLKVFVLSECHSITSKTYRTLSKYSANLTALSVSLMDSLTGKGINLSKSIEVLVLSSSIFI
jgi:hypothetical protein